ncbi:MAG TPA: RNA 2'-phosphotransferase [Candidatus Hodarchaeales archaeon]|nr:RNA 2'-phosphotransferase [Candidatus Hodarchaeales archaeon]
MSENAEEGVYKRGNLGRLSKYLTLILRHRPEAVGVTLDNQGWTDLSVEEFAEQVRTSSSDQRFSWVTVDDIEEVVLTDPKNRYEISSKEPRRIRATYGHSVKLTGFLDTSELPENVPSPVFYGCTNTELESLLKMGISTTNRQIVHLSIQKNDALAIARKKIDYSNPVREIPRIIAVDSRTAARSGIRFKVITPHVIVSDEIPPEFLSEVPVPHFVTNPDRRPSRNDFGSERPQNRRGPSDRGEEGEFRRQDTGRPFRSSGAGNNSDTSQRKERKRPAEITDEDFDFSAEDFRDQGEN